MPDLKKYIDLFKKNKYLLLVLAVGIILLLLPSGKEEVNIKEKWESLEFSIDECEEKIESILADCEGVGRVKVALSVSGSGESIYAEEVAVNTRENEEERSKDSDRKISVLSSGSGGEEPVIIEKTYPEFLGAAIVCDGAEMARVRTGITQTVSALTGLSSDKITIIKMKN